MISLSETLLLLAVISFTLWAPYTKVEESFNLHAIHDMLTLGITPTSASKYDHLEFPGAVPRTFIGALAISAITYCSKSVLQTFNFVQSDGFVLQILVRLSLGLCNACALIYLSRRITHIHGLTTGRFFLAFQGTQFHVIYYASRTLPNMFALPITTIATSYLIDPTASIYHAITLMTCATTLFRAEILLLLLATLSWHLLVTRRLELYKTIKVGLKAGLFTAGLSLGVDSYFWGYPVIPELSGFYFNAIQGKSSEWGVSPVYQYLIDLLKLLLNPAVSFILLPMSLVLAPEARNIVIPALAFVGVYSAQPHKEWRFIVYIVPQLTYAASLAASYILTHRSKNILYRLMNCVILASIPMTGLLSLMMLMISGMNYPGGEAMRKIDSLQGSGGPVYLDVMTCMTGSTQFLRVARPFWRTENSTLLQSVAFWDSIEVASVADLGQIQTVYDEVGKRSGWEALNEVYAFERLDFTQLKVVKSAKLHILRNNNYGVLHKNLPK